MANLGKKGNSFRTSNPSYFPPTAHIFGAADTTPSVSFLDFPGHVRIGIANRGYVAIAT
jgi:hypothetical protein